MAQVAPLVEPHGKNKKLCKVVDVKQLLINQRSYVAVSKIPAALCFALVGWAILCLPLSISPVGKADVIDRLRAATDPESGYTYMAATNCAQVHRVLIAFVRSQILSQSEEAFPNNPKLLIMPDEIQVHHVTYQLGSARELCVPASTVNATSLLTPTCIAEDIDQLWNDTLWQRDVKIGYAYRGNAIGQAIRLYNDATDDRAALASNLLYLESNIQRICSVARWAKLFVVLRDVHTRRRIDTLNFHSLMHGDSGISEYDPHVRAYKPFPRSMLNSSYTGLYRSGMDYLVLALQIVLALMILNKVLDETNQLRIFWKTGGTGYLRNFFNFLDWVGVLLMAFWLGDTWIYTLKEMNSNMFIFQRDVLDLTFDELGRLYEQGNTFNICYAVGLVGCAVNSTVVLQYLYVHRGLHAIALMFGKAWKQLLDIGAFIAYVGVTLSVALWIINANMGNNREFASFAASVQNTFLLAFGFYDYGTFAPDQQSFNDQSSASIMIFWVLVIVLVVIAQNIILAIVADAYGASRDELEVYRHPVDGSLSIFSYTILNICYVVQRVFFSCVRRQSLPVFIRGRVQHYGKKEGDSAVVMRQLVLSAAPELTTLLVYFAGEDTGHISDNWSPWSHQEDANALQRGGTGTSQKLGIADRLNETEFRQLLKQMSSCAAMTSFSELPFFRRPYAMPANTSYDWLVELVFEVYGEPGSSSNAKDDGTNSTGTSFTNVSGGVGGAAGATSAWEDVDTTCVITPGSVGVAAGRVSPQPAGGGGYRNPRRLAGGGGNRAAAADLQGLYQRLDEQQQLILQLLSEQREQRRQLERLEAASRGNGGGNWVSAGGSTAVVVTNGAVQRGNSLRARADMGLGAL